MTENQRDVTADQRRAIRAVVVVLVLSIAVSVTFALLTLLFRHSVLDYQAARDPGSDRAALERTLWTRPIPVLVVAVLYIGVVRGLLAGSPRALRRVRIVSAAGFLAVGWLVVSGAYPMWLRGVQIVQLALLAALVVTVNRRVVRSAFPAPAPDPRPRNRRAALLLVLLTPVVAEVSLGTVPLRMAWVIPIYLPIYGAGALLIREVVRRTGGGVASLLLAGVAYGLVEEGLALQSLTSRHLYDAAGWAPRLFGFNTAYSELNLVYHAVFSVAIPILLVELVFRRHGHAPYLRRGGVIVTGVVALLGAVLLRVTVPPSEDPGYTLPGAAALVIGALVVLFAVLALRLRPLPPPRAPLTPPPVAVTGVAVAVAAFTFLALIWPFAGAEQPFFTHGSWSLLPMAGAAMVVTGTLLTLRRWAASARWTPRHLLAALLGAVVGHTLFGLIGNADTPADRLFLAAVAVLTAAAGVHLARRLPANATATGAAAEEAAAEADPAAEMSTGEKASTANPSTAKPSAAEPGGATAARSGNRQGETWAR